MARLDETKIVDREVQLDLFASRLPCEGPERVLVVSGRSGMGKSDLLRKLRYACEYSHDVPVALLDMADFESRPDEFAIVRQLATELSRASGEQSLFPNFTTLDRARLFRDPHQFYEQGMQVQGRVDLSGAQVSGGTIAGVVVYAETYTSIWTEEIEQAARTLCTQTFLAELLTVARDRSIVIMVDTIDVADEGLKRWLFRDLLRNHLLARWADHHVVLLLAGKDVESILRPRLLEDQHQCVETLSPVSEWTLEQVEEFLSVHGFGTRIPALNPQDVQLVQGALVAGHPLTKVLNIAEQYATGDSE